jgi:toxin-antitoxin system PIN domain toxin
MRRHLLDVNVLLALLWPRHEGHAAAHTWFRKHGHGAWATNPLTQLGVVRLLTNPAVALDAVGPETAVAVLAEATRHPGHEFWPLERQIPDLLRPVARSVRGHRQWNDAALLCQAVDHEGAVVTFDSGLAELASAELSGRVVLLKHE